MGKIRILSIPEQIAAHLRLEIAQGLWRGEMPGRKELAKQYEVGISSVEQALRQLETERVLVTQGTGRTRRVADAGFSCGTRMLRIAVLAYEKNNFSEGVYSEAQHALRNAGHDAYFCRATLVDLGMNVDRVAKLVAKMAADAWVVCSAPREITEWFAGQSVPSFALFGRFRGAAMSGAGPDKASAAVAATRRLLDCGHRKIVMLVRPDRRLPLPGAKERAFLATLAAHGLPESPHYHLPDWENGMKPFMARLESLFRVSPPTALIVDELMVYLATQQFLARKRLLVPEDVSLVCMESDGAFDWCQPTVAHVHWDRAPVMRRLVSWANHVASGTIDIRKTLTKADFIDGGTVGPVTDRRSVSAGQAPGQRKRSTGSHFPGLS